MASGLKKWFAEKWVDIGSKKKGGGFKPCGRKSASGSKRKYPKCVPAAKAARMTESQRRFKNYLEKNTMRIELQA
jgi:hypothetical protein